MALTGREVCRSSRAAGRRQHLPVSVNVLRTPDGEWKENRSGEDVNGICLTNVYWVPVVQRVLLVVRHA